MIKLYSPNNPAELALIQSILEEERIQYFIHNDNFGSMEVGPSIDIFNMKTIMIDKKDEERARELLQDFFKTTKEDTETVQQSYSLFDKIRMAIEALIFMWFVPGRHKIKSKHNDTEKT
ncbi:MAG: DUF2007 domain-containing protein [Nitrospirota bacterium]